MYVLANMAVETLSTHRFKQYAQIQTVRIDSNSTHRLVYMYLISKYPLNTKQSTPIAQPFVQDVVRLLCTVEPSFGHDRHDKLMTDGGVRILHPSGCTVSEGYVFSALCHSSNTGIKENIYNSFLRLWLRKHIGSGAQLS